MAKKSSPDVSVPPSRPMTADERRIANLGGKSTIMQGPVPSVVCQFNLPPSRKMGDHPFDKALGLPVLTAPPPIRQSSITQCEVCERAALFAVGYSLRLQRKVGAAPVGSYAHHAMKHLIAGKTLPQVGDILSQAYTASLAPMDKSVLTDDDRIEMLLDLNKGFACGARLADVVHEKLASSITILASEFPLQIVVPELHPTRLVECRLDLVIQDSAGNVWVMDAKTASGSPKDVAALSQLKIQPFLYVYALRAALKANPKLFGGDPIGFPAVKGFMHAIVASPTIRRKGIGTPKEQSVGDYIDECHEWWDAKGRWVKNGIKWAGNPPAILHRQVIPGEIPGSILGRIADFTIKSETWPSQEAVDARDEVSYPPRERSCAPSPNMPCRFIQICTSPPRDWKAVVSRLYTTEPDPLADYGAANEPSA